MALIPVTPATSRRILHSGDKGADVKAYQRMLTRTLRHLGFVPVNRQSGLYGAGTLKDTLRLQRAKKIKQSGRVGLLTWQAVDPQMHAYERLLLKKKPPPPAPIGARFVHEARVLLALGMPFYTQARPAATTTMVWRRRGSDCSGSEGLEEANALGIPFDGVVNTDSIWRNDLPIAEHDVMLGDSILYGPGWKTTHVARVSDVERQLAIGFGSAPGREAGWRSYRTDVMGFRRRR